MLFLGTHSEFLGLRGFYLTLRHSFLCWITLVHLFGQYNIGRANRLKWIRWDFFFDKKIRLYFFASTVIDLYVQAFTNIFFEVFASVDHTLLV